MENTNFILLISCISIGALSLLFNIILMVRLSQVNKRMDDHGRFIYQMMKRSDEVKETSNDTSEGVTKVNETVTSLTSSIRSLVKQNQAQLKKANSSAYTKATCCIRRSINACKPYSRTDISSR